MAGSFLTVWAAIEASTLAHTALQVEFWLLERPRTCRWPASGRDWSEAPVSELFLSSLSGCCWCWLHFCVRLLTGLKGGSRFPWSLKQRLQRPESSSLLLSSAQVLAWVCGSAQTQVQDTDIDGCFGVGVGYVIASPTITRGISNIKEQLWPKKRGDKVLFLPTACKIHTPTKSRTFSPTLQFNLMEKIKQTNKSRT